MVTGMKPSIAPELLRSLRRRGHLGGTIAQHRAIWHQTLPRRRLVQGIALALGFATLLLLARHWIAQVWSDVLLWWLHALELPGHFAPGDARASGWFGLTAPVVAVELPAPDAWQPLRHGALLLLLCWCSGWLPDLAKPLAFLLRLGVLVHGAAVAFFMFWSASFAHALGSHVVSGLRQAWYLMLALPWIHLLTYYLFPFAAWQRAALTALSLAWLFVLTPLQYALHAALVHEAGLILLPLLNLLFGVTLPVVGIVALYGWAMGWRLRGGMEAGDGPAA